MSDDPTSQQARPRQGGYSRVHAFIPNSFFGKLLGLFGGLVALVLVFAFSLVLLAIIAVAAILIWGYLKFRASALRRAERRGDFDLGGVRGARRDHGHPPSGQGAHRQGDGGGLIIEGEALRQDEPGAAPKNQP